MSERNYTSTGSSHYKGFKIEPMVFVMENGLGFAEGNIVKYVSRYKIAGGVSDLRKAAHYLAALIEIEEGRDEEIHLKG